MKHLFTVMTLLLGLSLAGTASAASEIKTTQQWAQLLTKIIAEGTPVETENGVYLILTHKTPLLPPLMGHHVDYLSTVGFYDNEGIYRPMHLEGVSETWKVDANGHWDIDQWLFVVSVDNVLGLTRHNRILEESDGSILEYTTLPASEDEKALQWNHFLESWYLLL